MHSIFSPLEELPQDPIFGLVQAYKEEPRKEKINLGIGTYRTSGGESWVLPAVQETEASLLKAGGDKEYLPIEGDPQFIAQASLLAMGENKANTLHVQTVGGGSALRVAGDLLYRLGGQRKVYVSDPTWPNHHQVFAASGHKVETYPYFDRLANKFLFNAWLKKMETMEVGSAIVLHVCCHNPTGIDPTYEEWKEISKLVEERQLVPIFDMAYLGFSSHFDLERAPIELFYEAGHEFFLATSFSKNFGLYKERTGLLSVVSHYRHLAVLSHLKHIIRSTYSNPPAYGASIVREILQKEHLTHTWLENLASMRRRIDSIRHFFAEALQSALGQDMSFLKERKGMFSFIGLDEHQVTLLRERHALYLPKSGRVNFAALNEQNLSRVIEAIKDVQT